MTIKQKNVISKSRDKDNPYAIFKGIGPFGDTEVRVLKAYQKPALENENNYARWFIAVKSDYTYDSYDMGDSYINDCVRGLELTFASDQFKENYWHDFNDLQQRAGFFVKVSQRED
jgi:hypothetical protein